MNTTPITESDKNRFRYLTLLYEEWQQERPAMFLLASRRRGDVATRLGISVKAVERTAKDLQQRRLVESGAFTERISDAGRAAYRLALSRPDEPTVHFPASIRHACRLEAPSRAVTDTSAAKRRTLDKAA